MPVSWRPVSRATRPWPPSWAIVMALRERRQRVCGTTMASAAAMVAITTHRSGSDWVPTSRSQRSGSAVAAVLAMVSGGSSCPKESGSVARMCGRYAASRQPEDLAEVFEIEKWEPEETLEPDFNVAPTKEVHVVLDRPLKDVPDPRPVRQLRRLRWGLVPSWSKTPRARPG